MATNQKYEQEIWIKLTRSHHRILSRIEKELKKNNLPPLTWYDVLLELERSGTDGIRAFELRKKLLLPQYGLSRILTRMEKAGYLFKSECQDDGRGQILTITKEGREIRERSWLVYDRVLKASIDPKLDKNEQKLLMGLLTKLT